jgi:uncharacterized repeat protein (TIGR01451 family)
LPPTVRRSYRTTSLVLLGLSAIAALAPQAEAQQQTPIARAARYAGNLNFVTTGGSLRSQDNAGNACALSATRTQTLSGIPAGRTVLAAWLYWGGSATTGAGGATQVDAQVTLNGAAVTASRTFTAAYDNAGTPLPYFGAVADVTSRVTGNGSYTFGGLAVNAGAPHCAVQAVAAGWALVVIYQGSGEPLRAINVFDGLQYFRGSALTLTPDGFRTPPAGIDGSVAVVTLEGDPGNSGPLSGFSESLRFNGTALDDGLVPAGSSPTVQQFDGTVNTRGVVNSFGFDVDQYEVGTLLAPGQESATTSYSSGGDLVLLLAQIVSATSDPRVDLSVAKSPVAAPFAVGSNASYTLTVRSAAGPGLEREINPVSVTDTLPAGLTYVSAAGSGWTCAAVAQVVTCSRATPLDPGQSYPPITLTVAVGAAAAPAVVNTARVSSASFDPVAADNTVSVTTPVTSLLPGLRVQKLSEVLSDPANGTTLPKRIPGAIVRYSLVVTNTGPGSPDAASLAIVDPVPTGTSLFLAAPGSGFEFVDGAPASGLSFDPATSLSYSRQPGGAPPFDYVPVPDASGVDANVTAVRLAPGGTLRGASAAGTPGFTIRFRVRVR